MRNGAKNQCDVTGGIVYGHDGTDAYAIDVDTYRRLKTLTPDHSLEIARGRIPGAYALNKFGRI